MRNDKESVEKNKATTKGFCEICKTETNNLSNHVKFKHVKNNEIESLQEYYHKYVLKSDIRPVCLNCKKEVEFVSVNKGYKRTCSHLCSMNAPTIKAFVQNNAKEGLAKLGVVNISQLPGVSEKKKKSFQKHYGKNHIWCNKEDETRSCEITCLEKYGVKFPLQAPEIRFKVDETNFIKYGFTTASKNEDVKQKLKATVLERYNGFCFQKESLLYANFIQTITKNGGFTFERKESIEKVKQTMIKRYGVEYPGHSKEMLERGIATKLKKYGSKNNIKKIKQTNLKKYGVENVIHVPEYFMKAQMNNSQGKEKKYIKNIEGKEVGCSSYLEQKFVRYCNNKSVVVENGDCIDYRGYCLEHRKYYCDFKIREKDGRWRLVETKGNHKWWLKDLENGNALRKIEAAIKYSKEANYHPFVIIFNEQLKKRYISESYNNYDLSISENILTKDNHIDSVLF